MARGTRQSVWHPRPIPRAVVTIVFTNLLEFKNQLGQYPAMSTTSAQNGILRGRLLELLRQEKAAPLPAAQARPGGPEPTIATAPDAHTDLTEPIDVVVSLNEINDKHGTGPLL